MIGRSYAQIAAVILGAVALSPSDFIEAKEAMGTNGRWSSRTANRTLNQRQKRKRTRAGYKRRAA